jgi:hypothetical protein
MLQRAGSRPEQFGRLFCGGWIGGAAIKPGNARSWSGVRLMVGTLGPVGICRCVTGVGLSCAVRASMNSSSWLAPWTNNVGAP